MTPDGLLTAAALLLPTFWAVGARNRLARLRGAARTAWLRTDDRLKARHELLLRFVDAAGPGLPQAAEQVAALAAARNSAAAARQGVLARTGAADALGQLTRAEAALDAALLRVLDPVIAAGVAPAPDPLAQAVTLPLLLATSAQPAVPAPAPAAALAGLELEFDAEPAALPAEPPVPFPPPGLFDELDAVCTQLDVARHAYNAAAEAHNAAIAQFPARLLAGAMRLKPIGEAASLGSRATIAPLVRRPAAGD
ncbi:hypothetical protein [Derxia lacustris]|uniref:hypothetical protein n=1 Tax=Derxia lacustris TaxID=764842 RepID=UPI000A1739A6|nr:hypothetical protein [Derxia lacustris]